MRSFLCIQCRALFYKSNSYKKHDTYKALLYKKRSEGYTVLKLFVRVKFDAFLMSLLNELTKNTHESRNIKHVCQKIKNKILHRRNSDHLFVLLTFFYIEIIYYTAENRSRTLIEPIHSIESESSQMSDMHHTKKRQYNATKFHIFSKHEGFAKCTHCHESAVHNNVAVICTRQVLLFAWIVCSKSVTDMHQLFCETIIWHLRNCSIII